MSTLKGEQEVAGLRCSAVLTGLTEYMSGGLDAETRKAVEAHVRGCDRCERFGGAFGATIRAIRKTTSEPSVDVLERLQARLR